MGTAIVLLILVVVVTFVVKGMIRDRKNGKHCGGDCGHCGGHCSH